LAKGDDRAGRLLRDADQAYRSQLSEELAWKRFQSQRQQWRVVRFTLLAVALGLAVVVVRHRWSEPRIPVDVPTLVAERVPTPPPSSHLPSPSRAAALDRRIPPSPSASVVPVRSSGRAPSSGAIVARSSEPLTDSICRSLVSQARSKQAVDCFQMLARESGLGAEVALYEAARLSAEALGDPRRALALLEQHGTRFPASVLRVEVEWLKIRSLERAGRLDEALSASETLLDSAAGRSLASKLHLLRGRIHAESRHDCPLAVTEFVALLGEPGPAGDEAEFKRAQCLEQMRRPDEARSAYLRYLGRVDPRSADVARARLEALSNAAHPEVEH